MPKTIALLQVRMKSTRLPRKALIPLQGKPIVEHVIDRLKAARTLDSIVLCTSTHQNDAVLLELAQEKGIPGFAGDEEDVLNRFIQAAHWAKADTIVRVCGENPLMDPEHIDRFVERLYQTGSDYVSTRQLPVGTKGEVITVKALEKAHQLAENPEMSEYMTLYFQDDFFKVELIEVAEGVRRPNYRLTVDTPADLELLQEIYKRLYKPNGIIPLPEAIHLLDEHPELCRINAQVKPVSVDRVVITSGPSPKIRIVVN